MASFRLFVQNEAKAEIRALPGHMRQRASRAVRALAGEPRPPASRVLDVQGVAIEVRRLRIDRWRVIYTIDSDLSEIVVYAVRKRPPYDYTDLETLLESQR